jgi:hypothetical protein
MWSLALIKNMNYKRTEQNCQEIMWTVRNFMICKGHRVSLG